MIRSYLKIAWRNLRRNPLFQSVNILGLAIGLTGFIVMLLYQKLYAEYLSVQQVVTYFTVVAVLIAVIGLFAMSVFLVREKTKELGIRKVLGAGAKDIFKVTSLKFLLQVMAAMAIAAPLGWIAAEKWLQNFAYRFDLNASVFLTAAAILLVVAIATVSFQAIKAMFANPVKTLRTE